MNKKLIRKAVVLYEEYSIYRYLRQGSTTHVRNKGLSELDINTANIWINTERKGGSRANKNVVEHYSQIKMMLPTLLRHSQTL